MLVDIGHACLDAATVLVEIGAHNLDVQAANAGTHGHGAPFVTRQRPGIDGIRDDDVPEAQIVFGNRVRDAIALAFHLPSRVPQCLLDRVDAHVHRARRSRQCTGDGCLADARETTQDHQHASESTIVTVRAIVIGAGIAGLSAAIALRKVGIDVAVYERAPALGDVGAGIGLWANAFHALDHLGVGDAVRERSQPMVRSEMRTDNGRKVLMVMDAASLEKAFGVREIVRMIHRADLIDALASFVPHAAVNYGYECMAVDRLAERPRVRFTHGETDEADVVIGADGIRSAVRNAFLPPEEPRYAGYTCWRGVCPRPPHLTSGYMTEWWGCGRRLGIVSLPGDRVYWFAVENAPPNMAVANDRTHLLQGFADWADPAATIFETTPDSAIVRNDIIDRAPPQAIWTRERVGLIGDAAHPTTPNLGQGGCLAIEDAVVLARQLATNPDIRLALQAFARERYPRAMAIVRESWIGGRIAQAEGRLTCALRDRTIGMLSKVVSPTMFLKHARFDVGPLPAMAALPVAQDDGRVDA
jgi:2-polyprenyl-6-methoxyphenol hydroxylase-like FAD-dependent oxidoreductase